jgi:hypothetical protein
VIWAIAAGSIVFLLGLVVFLARREGAKAAQIGGLEKGVDHAKEANEIEEANRGLSDADVDKRLFGDKP